MSTARVGSNKEYAEGWEKVFGGSKSVAKKKKTAKKASPKKKSTKKKSTKKKAKK